MILAELGFETSHCLVHETTGQMTLGHRKLTGVGVESFLTGLYFSGKQWRECIGKRTAGKHIRDMTVEDGGHLHRSLKAEHPPEILFWLRPIMEDTLWTLP